MPKLNRNTFLIPEIIFDPTLVLSPYVFLLGMLFRIGIFKSLSKDGPIIDYLKKLYYLRVLYRLTLREPSGIRITLEEKLTKGWLSYRMKRGSEIIGFAEVAKPYCLQYSVVKAFNDSLSILLFGTIAWFASLMSRSINPRRPYRLEDSSYINEIPYVRTLEERK
ncbi:hypothetical protein N7475_007728 [Penicillium sp. IBT 31633x]|nr:hypothetical protein N7475_007728 [Penicillium sp. IBT 31633x]